MIEIIKRLDQPGDETPLGTPIKRHDKPAVGAGPFT